MACRYWESSLASLRHAHVFLPAKLLLALLPTVRLFTDYAPLFFFPVLSSFPFFSFFFLFVSFSFSLCPFLLCCSSRRFSCTYGLAATVWCRDGPRSQRLARAIHAGTVWINCWLVRDLNMPFGGVKASGSGRESAEESIDYYTEAKTVCMALDGRL